MPRKCVTGAPSRHSETQLGGCLLPRSLHHRRLPPAPPHLCTSLRPARSEELLMCPTPAWLQVRRPDRVGGSGGYILSPAEPLTQVSIPIHVHSIHTHTHTHTFSGLLCADPLALILQPCCSVTLPGQGALWGLLHAWPTDEDAQGLHWGLGGRAFQFPAPGGPREGFREPLDFPPDQPSSSPRVRAQDWATLKRKWG